MPKISRRSYMKVKGTAFIARRESIIKNFGKEKWEEFIGKFAEKESFFKNSILPTSKIPAELFIEFNDAIMDKFYSNESREKILWKLGRESANWALTEGPYQSFLKKRDIKDFFENNIPLLWDLYFTEGRVQTAECKDNSCKAVIVEVPIKNDYFELAVMSFVERALELISQKQVKTIRHKSLISDGVIDYEFVIE